MDLKAEISDEIRKIRHRTMMTQPEFVRRYNALEPTDVRITEHSLSQYENGHKCPSAIRYRKLQLMEQYSVF